jgi:hypothetical protein
LSKLGFWSANNLDSLRPDAGRVPGRSFAATASPNSSRLQPNCRLTGTTEKNKVVAPIVESRPLQALTQVFLEWRGFSILVVDDALLFKDSST